MSEKWPLILSKHDFDQRDLEMLPISIAVLFIIMP